MAIKLLELARLIGGELTGDGDIEIKGAGTLRQARPSEITLADSIKSANKLAVSQASAVVVGKGITPENLPFITVDDVHESFSKIVRHFRPPRQTRREGISPLARVSPYAVVGDDVDIHPGATIGDDAVIGKGTTIHAGVHVMAGCRIGKNVTIFPGAVLYDDTILGDRCIIHANVVLGAYGFGYGTVDGQHKLCQQLGNVIIENDVEIGACSTVDRGTYGPTVIGEGTKLDNQVQVAHNCRIGRHNMICSQVGVAGTVTTGDHVVMAGQVGVRDHVDIGNQVILGAKAGVMNSVPDGETYAGIPATPWQDQRHKQAAWTKLPEMRKEFKQLQKSVAKLVASQEVKLRADAA
jgi:UDP-3-O-[3-hydroxymyristoyl] glucosamine N-acyltransferase